MSAINNNNIYSTTFRENCRYICGIFFTGESSAKTERRYVESDCLDFSIKSAGTGVFKNGGRRKSGLRKVGGEVFFRNRGLFYET